MALYPGFPLAKSDYTVGTINLTNGSKNFTLSGSNPLDFAAAQAGDEIYIPKAGKLLLIETITNTGGTLLYNCPSDCAGANQPFHLRLKPSASRLQGMVTTLLQKLGSGNLASIDNLTLAENHVIAGGQVAGQVKAINLPAQMNAKFDKIGGTVTGTLKATNHVALRFTNGVNSPAVIMRKDGAQFDMLLTNAGDADGTFNALRPFRIYLDSGDIQFGHTVSALGEIQAKALNGLRFTQGSSPSVIVRKDSNNFYFLLTDEGSPYGDFNARRPFFINLTSGRVVMNEGLNVANSINIYSGLLKIGTAEFYSNGAIKGSIWEDWHISGFAKTAIAAYVNTQIAAALANL